MFNLKDEINKWLKGLRSSKQFQDGDIEEIRSHISDKINDLVNSGISEEEAFKSAITEFGDINQIENEYNVSLVNKALSNWKNFALIINYFKTSLRFLLKQKGYSLINIFGLTIGISSLLIISLMISNELSYDSFHKNYDNIYRVYMKWENNGTLQAFAPVPVPLNNAVKGKIPAIKNITCVTYKSEVINYKEKKFYEELLFVDSDFFKIFSFNYNYHSITSLDNPFNAFITKSAANKYFGKNNPLGETVYINNDVGIKITGVIENLPPNTHIKGEIFVSNKTLSSLNFERLNNWNSTGNDYIYILANKNSNISRIQSQINRIALQNFSTEKQEAISFHLQKLSDIHFEEITYDNGRTIKRGILYVFFTIGLCILLIACFNFINLSIAKLNFRHKEIGIRKTIGAASYQIMNQNFIETFIITAISFSLSIIISLATLPIINSSLQGSLQTNNLFSADYIIFLLLFFLITLFVAGSYPAYFISRFNPQSIFKSALEKKKSVFRSSLVGIQFIVSVVLIFITIIIVKQLNYVFTKDLGFSTKNLIFISLNSEIAQKNSNFLKNEILKIKGVKNASISNGVPGSGYSSSTNIYTINEKIQKEVNVQIISIDENFLNTLKIKQLKGRAFSKDIQTDTSSSFLINKTAAKLLGFNDPVGKQIAIGNRDPRNIIGVINDFHYFSLNEKIPPTIFSFKNETPKFINIEINMEDFQQISKSIKKLFDLHISNTPVEIFKAEKEFEEYSFENKVMGTVAFIASILAIILSSIGILGLVSFTMAKKKKEIGVRKILGASILEIIIMISKNYYSWIFISTAVALPIGIILMNMWLDLFAYKTSIDLLSVFYTLIFAFGIASLTVIRIFIQTAFTNPIESIRYE